MLAAILGVHSADLTALLDTENLKIRHRQVRIDI